MTQEEKVRAYDEALEKAKSMIDDLRKGEDILAVSNLESMFPELKETEDERISREISEFISNFYNGNYEKPYDSTLGTWVGWLEKQAGKDKLIQELGKYKVKYTQEILNKYINSMSKKDDERLRKTTIGFLKEFADKGYENAVECIDWLEKQGNTNETIDRDKFTQGVLKGAAINLITWIDYNAAEGNMCLSNVQCKEIENALVRGDWNKIYAYMKRKLERQDEQKSIFDFNANDWYVSKVDGKIHNIYHSEVEPKFNFKVGQWIVATGKCVYLITKIDGFNVTLVDTIGNEYVFDVSSLADAHLWTIQDAKDGDVLNANGAPFIYKKHDKDCVYFYCGVNLAGEFVEANEFDIWNNNNKVYPAIKEQRDLLFQKMKDAGYKWDEEKKEVKIIEWNNIVRDSIFDEDIDIPFGTCDSKPYYQEIYIPDGFQATIEGRKIILKKEENKL